MIHCLFKKSRKGKKSASWYGRYKFDWMDRPRELNLHVTDKREAEKALRRIEEHARRENSAPSGDESIEISIHLDEFLNARKAAGRTAHYLKTLESSIGKLCEECNWRYLPDINPYDFESWRALTDRSEKTLNEYLAALKAFANYLIAQGRMSVNPLNEVHQLNADAKKRKRRILSEDEIRRLIEVAPVERQIAYLLAIYCALGRKEIESLQWKDMQLDTNKPFLTLHRASPRERTIALRRDLASFLAYFRDSRPRRKHILEKIPRMRELKKSDWTAANIRYIDEKERLGDFDSLKQVFLDIVRHPAFNLEKAENLPSFIEAEKFIQAVKKPIIVDKLPEEREVTVSVKPQLDYHINISIK